MKKMLRQLEILQLTLFFSGVISVIAVFIYMLVFQSA